MALTQVQEGVIGQSEAAKVFMIGSDGEVEVALPVTDDDHRDIETHRRGRFIAAMPVQIKTRWVLWKHRHSEILQIPFSVAVARLRDDPHFWYLFGYFDKERMAFRDPIFLVPSTEVHRHAQPRLRAGRWHFTFQASLKPGAMDRWSPYRISTAEAGQKLLAIIQDLERNGTTSAIPTEARTRPELLWLRRRPRSVRRQAA